MKTSTLERRFLNLWQRRHLIGGPDWVAELPEPEREKMFHPTRKWRFDFSWPAYRVAVEVDGGVFTGGRHTQGAAYASDCVKQNAAVELGWVVLRFTARELSRDPVDVIKQVARTMRRRGIVADVDEQLSLF